MSARLVTRLERLTVCAATGLVLAGCSLLQPGFGEPEIEAPTPPAPVEPVVAHRFAIDDATQTVFGEVQRIRVRDEDTFSDIARTYGLGYDELVLANPDVDPWLPGEGTEVLLPTRFVLPDAPRDGIVLNIAEKRLYVFLPAEGDAPATLITHPVGIGRVGWATPVGQSTVTAKATDPTWYPPASVRQEHREMGDPLPAIVPPGPDNPLGRHVLKLDMPGYLLHGTNQPYGVGMRVSHGCVRLYPEDIERLYAMTPIGTRVTIVNAPIAVGQRGGDWFVRAVPQLEDDERDWQDLLDDALARYTPEGDTASTTVGLDDIARDGLARALGATPALASVLVVNVTAPPADAPDRETVATMLDELLQEAAEEEAGDTVVN